VVPSDTPTQPATVPPAELAPDPLPAYNTGVPLYNGECFDFETGFPVTPPDLECDVFLNANTVFQQINGAKLSGYVTMKPPTRTYCINATYEPGDLAIQTDLYYCFITNQGQPGFVVVRQYLGGVPMTGIVFDFWIFH
jgi:hypothetical protein